MPDQFGFTHEPHHGTVYHRCVSCDVYPWGCIVREELRREHFEQHQRERNRASDQRRRDALKLAQQAQRLRSQEAAFIEERYGAPQRTTKGVTMADEAANNGQLADELRSALEAIPAKLVEKKAYHRIETPAGQTLGYAYLGVRKPSVEVPTGHGSYDRLGVASTQDIAVVLNKLQEVADRAAAKKATAETASAKPKAAPKAEAEVVPDPKPKRQRKSRAKAAA